jgi:Fur family ferric uptake transcriptional regulator
MNENHNQQVENEYHHVRRDGDLRSNGAMTTDLHDSIRARLAARDVRYTGGRQAVVRLLLNASGPMSASDIHGTLDSVPLSSLYRSLTVLDEAGVLARHHDAEGVARFEPAEWISGHHHHLVCIECGDLTDVALDEDAERMLDELAGRLASTVGHELRGHVLEVEGVCGSCRR